MTEDLFTAIPQWGYKKEIIFRGNETRQMLKTAEEVGEMAAALARDNMEDYADACADVIVTVVVGAACRDIRPEEVLVDVLKKLNERTGATVDGVFRKDGE